MFKKKKAKPWTVMAVLSNMAVLSKIKNNDVLVSIITNFSLQSPATENSPGIKFVLLTKTCHYLPKI